MPPDPIHLFPSQRGLIEAGYGQSDEHWLICAPTGSGKTRMGEWAIEKAWASGLTAAYVAPLKAIVEERVADWSTRYASRTVRAYTGATNLGHRPATGEHLMLFTPEKLASYLGAWKHHLDWISGLGVLLIDELHLLGDPSRGPALESLIGRIERVNPFIRIVGLSATLSNAAEVAAWLGARLYQTQWRPVPVGHRLHRYKRPSDKPEHLVEEVVETRAVGGRTLVFVNSRRRAELLAAHLQAHQFTAAFTHAGLPSEEQALVHARMRSGQLDAVVATSTLEMGVNLPARKVVVYDNYAFEGDAFRPLRVQRYLQFAGRAGRPGLDTQGECVLFAPIWDGSADDLIRGSPEPVRSGLFSSAHLGREVLHDISSRLSISERHLEVNFAGRTLWRHQGGQRNLSSTVRLLVKGGLVKEVAKDEQTYLSHTALGRIATQMSLSPDTVVMLSQVYAQVSQPTDFDLLLAICLSDEVTPKLGFNFEEIDDLGDAIQLTPSHLLDWPAVDVAALRRTCTDQALLSAIKCSAILEAHTRLEEISALAERHDCYPADLQALKRNTLWLLEAAQRIFAVLNRQQFLQEHEGEEAPGPPTPSLHEGVVKSLRLMVEYGIPKGAVSLVNIEGVGAKRAQRLCAEGIFAAAEVANYSAEHLADLLGISAKTAERILASARNESVHTPQYRSIASASRERHVDPWPGATAPLRVDPYRLRRALELTIDHLSAEAVRVSGGTEPHTIQVNEDASRTRSYICDCADFARGQFLCKHVIRAKLALHDDADIRPILDAFSRPQRDRPLRYAVGDLWMNAGRLLDRYMGRASMVGPSAADADRPHAEAARRRR